MYKALGAERDRGGVPKPSQFIETFLEIENQLKTWRAPSEGRAGPWGLAGDWGRSVHCYQTVIHTYCVPLFTTRPLREARGSLIAHIYGETEAQKVKGLEWARLGGESSTSSSSLTRARRGDRCLYLLIPYFLSVTRRKGALNSSRKVTVLVTRAPKRAMNLGLKGETGLPPPVRLVPSLAGDHEETARGLSRSPSTASAILAPT